MADQTGGRRLVPRIIATGDPDRIGARLQNAQPFEPEPPTSTIIQANWYQIAMLDID